MTTIRSGTDLALLRGKFSTIVISVDTLGKGQLVAGLQIVRLAPVVPGIEPYDRRSVACVFLPINSHGAVT